MIEVTANTLSVEDGDDFTDLLARTIDPTEDSQAQLMGAIVYTSSFYATRGCPIAWNSIERHEVSGGRLLRNSLTEGVVTDAEQTITLTYTEGPK